MKRLGVVVVTGLSGAGKSTALRVFEDLGYFCVDNLPAALVPAFAAMCAKSESIQRVALGMDVRVRALQQDVGEALSALSGEGYSLEVIFLDATDEVLLRRYAETRRPHPLAPGGDVPAGIRAEREVLAPVRARADLVVDTTMHNPHSLRRVLTDHIARSAVRPAAMMLRFVSFGYKHGVPADVDLVLDTRFLPNPYFVPELRARAGNDPEVAAYVLKHEEAQQFLRLASALMEYLVPFYEREGKSYLTVALGCTGGRHRSVALAEALAERFSTHRNIEVVHRDVERG